MFLIFEQRANREPKTIPSHSTLMALVEHDSLKLRVKGGKVVTPLGIRFCPFEYAHALGSIGILDSFPPLPAVFLRIISILTDNCIRKVYSVLL